MKAKKKPALSAADCVEMLAHKNDSLRTFMRQIRRQQRALDDVRGCLQVLAQCPGWRHLADVQEVLDKARACVKQGLGGQEK